MRGIGDSTAPYAAQQAAHPPRAEDVAVGEELRAQVSDGEPRQHHLGARVRALLELVVDDVPLGVHDRLVLRGVAQPDLRSQTCIFFC